MIETRHLFTKLDAKLIELLRSLSQDDWQKPTIARLWNVKHVASHLLDTNLRTLSMARDGHFVAPDREISSYFDLVAYLNQLNADWIKATERIGTTVLTDLLESTGKENSQFIQTLDPHAPAIFAVAWAGETTSKNWFHIAREFTEKWHHQQQIRDAVDKQGIITREFFYPFIDTLLQGLPHAYRDVNGTTGDVVRIEITSEVGGRWYLLWNDSNWILTKATQKEITSAVTITPEVAWKLFTKGLSMDTASSVVIIEGNETLARPVLSLVSVMA